MKVKSLSKSGDIISMGFSGARELQRKLEDWSRAGNGLNEEVEDAMQDAMEKVKVDSQALCPIDTGRLRESASVAVYRHRNGALHASVSYDTPYAVYVHENPDAYHKAPTTFKFLEIAMLNNRPNIERMIRDAIRTVARG